VNDAVPVGRGPDTVVFDEGVYVARPGVWICVECDGTETEVDGWADGGVVGTELVFVAGGAGQEVAYLPAAVAFWVESV